MIAVEFDRTDVASRSWVRYVFDQSPQLRVNVVAARLVAPELLILHCDTNLCIDEGCHLWVTRVSHESS